MKYITKINPESQDRPLILIAPLDWGLGHASRCIPIIHYLLSIDYEVIIAGEGIQIAFLKQEFPTIKTIDLPGYRLKYGKTGWKTILKIIFQIPKMLTSIKSENRWLNRILKENKVRAIISDNRYGLYHPTIPCFFITHQLAIQSPFGIWGEWILQKLNYRLINKFTECWVPDYSGEQNLAGKLSHPAQVPGVPVSYLGPLTRFSKEPLEQANELLIILSGPEPQRTLLEKLCLKELKEYHKPAVLLRGLPGSTTSIQPFNRVTIYNHLPSDELNRMINSSKVIISRPGYSTVMDTLGIGKNCIFIATPGQTEQEYLSTYLSSKKHCLAYNQGEFSLKMALEALQMAKLEPFNSAGNDEYKNIIRKRIEAKALRH